MSAAHEDEPTVMRRRDRGGEPIDYRKVRRALARGSVLRIAPGAYALPNRWEQLTPRARHRLRVVEAAGRTRQPGVFSHFAAAAIWGIDILGAWPDRIDMRTPPGSGGRSSGLIRRHALRDAAQVWPWRGHEVTTPAQTALDIAAEVDLLHAVVVLDQVLWARRPGGALAQVAELWALVEQMQSAKGRTRAVRAIAHASELSDSVRESQSRVLIRRLGFPEPRLQQPFVLPDGREVRTDYYFEEFDHVGEFDGVGKYLDPSLTRGKTPEQALIDEKDREDALRRLVRGLSRWRTPDLRHPRRLYDILLHAGLRTTAPPPAPGLYLPD